MDDGGVVATAKLLPYRGVRDIEVLAEDIHDDLSRLDYLLSPGLFVDRLLFYGVKVRDNLNNVLNSHRLLRFGNILNNILHVIETNLSLGM